MHVLLIAVASLTVLNASITRVPETSGAMRGELDPVDNRADKGKIPGSGGGSPGEIGGLGSIAFVAPAAGANPQGPGLDPAADALLNEILPSTATKPAEALQRALPGPQTTGVGLVAGTGLGGDGGSGGGSGGGVGRGIGPGTEFFGAREHGQFVRLRHRLLRQHGLEELAGGGQARAPGQPQPASPRRAVRGYLLRTAGPRRLPIPADSRD